MQAAGGIMLPLFLFMATNKDSGCRFVLWMQRDLGLAAGSSTPAYRPQFAGIIETLDLVDRATIDALAVRLAGRPLDILLHNSGISGGVPA